MQMKVEYVWWFYAWREQMGLSHSFQLTVSFHSAIENSIYVEKVRRPAVDTSSHINTAYTVPYT
jgi:hypothetical protein